MNLGKRFKKYRQKVGLTQKEAAELIGINSYQLGNYETNRSEPSIAILKGMSKAYKVSVDDLIGNNIKEIPEKSQSDDYLRIEKAIKEFMEFYESKDEEQD